MSARTAANREKQLKRLRIKYPEVAAILEPEKADTSLFIDGEYSTHEAVVELRSGPADNEVGMMAEVSIVDAENEDPTKVDTVLVHWSMWRACLANGVYSREETRCDGDTFKLDEIESWVTALYKAVQLAKKRGYLPSGPAR